jgi:hypothetical protein
MDAPLGCWIATEPEAPASKFEFRSLGRQRGRVFQEFEDFSTTLSAESP